MFSHYSSSIFCSSFQDRFVANYDCIVTEESHLCAHSKSGNRIGGVVVSVLASSGVDHGFESLWGQTKDYEMGIVCFSSNDIVLRSKGKD